MATTQTDAPPAAACRPHDWRPPEPTADRLTCGECGAVVRFHPGLATRTNARLITAVERHRGPAAAAEVRACINAYYRRIYKPRDPAAHVTQHGRPSRRERTAERGARRPGGAA